MSRPIWFEKVIASLDYEDRFVTVHGEADPAPCVIHYQLFRPAHGAKACGSVVLVHGGGAHSHWWDWTAPFLAEDGYLVGCIDLAGQGDSAKRELYSMTDNAIEVNAVAAEVTKTLLFEYSLDTKPYLVGHSYGGWVVMLCAKNTGTNFGGVITLDSPVPHPNAQVVPSPPPRGKKKKGTKTLGEMLQRFRLIPPQTTTNEYLIDYIAALSIKTEVVEEDGATTTYYVWKEDPDRMNRMQSSDAKPGPINAPRDPAQEMEFKKRMSERLQELKCPLSVFYGTESFFFADPKTLQHMRSELDAHKPGGLEFTPMVGLEGAQHHVMFDQPLVVIASLRTTLGEWRRQGVAGKQIKSKM
eukprot:gnl/MRDRNA2_/MRDRNA2_78020_c0_seq1.p1 gnl/MRDRNA2_/MRDRNA2_78020_c0~~gnl/MRDRNA2_/MRDRNA2_78020_c0_seq1.p1  ORF type:complete len:380 (+),score=51.54 gnl/MRDRNA2_/MRDRNA2_78020_c0_seq1:75-1142(+)